MCFRLGASSIEYERWINEAVRARLGGTSSADLIIRSFNFSDVEHLQAAGQWHQAGEMLAAAARDLQNAGAGAIVICTNTMHSVADQVAAAVSVPVLHIADATAEAVIAAGVDTVALLGTRYTMEQDFYVDRLRSHRLQVLVPDEPDRTLVHNVIYDELVRGLIRPASRAQMLDVIDRLVHRGARGVIAGCTEIELLVSAEDVDVPYFPTAKLHALAAADFALGE